MLTVLLLVLLAVVAGVLSGVVGTGASLVLLPALLWAYGPRVAVPVMAIAAVLGNLGRVVAWWRVIAWRPTVAYAAGGVPAAVLGARVLLTIPQAVADGVIAAFFLAMIVARRTGVAARWRFRVRHMIVAGAVVGFLTGMLFSTGPLSVPVFTGYGLGGGAFLGSEAAASLLIYAGKLATFGAAGALPAVVVVRGLLVGGALLAGSVIARRVVERIGVRTHATLIDIVLAVGAATMIVAMVR
ncbi:sulfite exporter TauE/SafE family protein [Actinoplanes sp. NBRC 101535]|uniref:sulfite exporter TauE/SafE family protein n=1 Tax=Actinoplanes sp. NBRC 101535 TaxID=3032196 RepID=UPI0024A1A938|nr:sulfite exporter TauE/SafE family protein [Actinoplanes sp. NBRC 101535]GLY03983.1 UPF0721 transmembrane protein [Actinoplanes sp. NBRC 101535]